MSKKLTDSSPMPYGKHRGLKMEDVPADYLLWLYKNDKTNEEVREYIEENLDVLNKEAKDNVKLKDSKKVEKKIPDCCPIPFKNKDNESF